MGWTSRAASFSAGIAVALIAFLALTLTPDLLPALGSSLSHLAPWSSSDAGPAAFVCSPQPYTTQIVSESPLLIYIHDFLSAPETAALLSAGAPLFKPSMTTKNGRSARDTSRTSWTAGLDRTDPAAACVLSRAEAFMGTMLSPGRGDEMGAPQLVRYGPGQKFDLHHDWYPRPQRSRLTTAAGGGGGFGPPWNRPASFFAVLEDGCEGGETYFPHVQAVSSQEGGPNGKFPWREHEDGGLAFRPVAGNALFWVNLFANGTGDERTRHAGLPVVEGLKTAMNIWPRRYVE